MKLQDSENMKKSEVMDVLSQFCKQKVPCKMNSYLPDPS